MGLDVLTVYEEQPMCCFCGQPIEDGNCVALLITTIWTAEEDIEEYEISAGSRCVSDNYMDELIAHTTCLRQARSKV